jgi:hypothetical protein
MKPFEEFYNDLVSDDLWFDSMAMIHRGKSVRQAAQLIYGEVLSDPEKYKFYTVQEFRKYVHNKLSYLKPEPVKVVQNWQEIPNSDSPLPAPLPSTPEEKAETDKLIAEYLKQLGSASKEVPKLTREEIEREGQVRPGAYSNFAATRARATPMSVVKQLRLHNDWIKECFDPHTGNPNENWLEEREWLKLRDL